MIAGTVAADIEQAVYCPHCGYDLRTLTRDTCPECGGEVDMAALQKPQVPWVYRKDIGTLRAFAKTIWLVTFKTKRFCYEIAHPVDLDEALRFRRTVVWVVFCLLATVMGALMYVGREHFDTTIYRYEGSLVTGVIALYAVLIWFFLYVWTGVHTYWFHPRHIPVEHQNRAVALSYYACAPLMLLPLVVLVMGTGIGLMLAGDYVRGDVLFNTGAIVFFIAMVSVVILLVAFGSVCVTMARHAASRGAGGQCFMAVTLGATWAVLGGLMLVGIPIAMGYLGLMVYTLWL